MLQVMDQQRIEINNLKEELDTALDENVGLTQAHETMVWRLKDLWKEVNELTENLAQEKKTTQHLKDSHSSEVNIYEEEVAALKRLLAEKECKLTLFETIIGDDLHDYIG
jgi:regulator of replication initiation timing